MTKPESESITDIVAEMREHAFKWAKDPELAAILERYANRIEEAQSLEQARIWNEAYDTGFNDRACN